MTFSEKQFTRMLSLSVTIGLIGAIYGGGPVSYLCSEFGYKKVVIAFAILGLVLAMVTYLIVPEVSKTKESNILSNIREVFTNKKVLAVCLLAGLMVGPLEGFADVWGAEFFKQVYNFDASTSNYLASIIFVGMCFGAPVLSMVAEKTNSYIGSIVIAGLVMAISFTALIASVLTKNIIMVGFVLVGICCSYQIIAIYKASTYVSVHVAGLTTAVANMIIMIFGYGFHSSIGYIINLYIKMNPALAYIYGVAVIPAALTIGVVGFVIIAIIDKKDLMIRNV
jgi:MFS family permease